MDADARIARGVEGLRLALGTWSLTAPARSPIERVLGARQVAQSVVVGRTGWHALSAVVDLLHGTSMLAALAVAPRRTGRFAAVQAATAAVLIALELAAQRAER